MSENPGTLTTQIPRGPRSMYGMYGNRHASGDENQRRTSSTASEIKAESSQAAGGTKKSNRIAEARGDWPCQRCKQVFRDAASCDCSFPYESPCNNCKSHQKETKNTTGNHSKIQCGRSGRETWAGPRLAARENAKSFLPPERAQAAENVKSFPCPKPTQAAEIVKSFLPPQPPQSTAWAGSRQAAHENVKSFLPPKPTVPGPEPNSYEPHDRYSAPIRSPAYPHDLSSHDLFDQYTHRPVPLRSQSYTGGPHEPYGRYRETNRSPRNRSGSPPPSSRFQEPCRSSRHGHNSPPPGGHYPGPMRSPRYARGSPQPHDQYPARARSPRHGYGSPQPYDQYPARTRSPRHDYVSPQSYDRYVAPDKFSEYSHDRPRHERYQSLSRSPYHDYARSKSSDYTGHSRYSGDRERLEFSIRGAAAPSHDSLPSPLEQQQQINPADVKPRMYDAAEVDALLAKKAEEMEARLQKRFADMLAAQSKPTSEKRSVEILDSDSGPRKAAKVTSASSVASSAQTVPMACEKKATKGRGQLPAILASSAPPVPITDKQKATKAEDQLPVVLASSTPLVPIIDKGKATNSEVQLPVALDFSTPPVHAASEPKSAIVEDRLLATLASSAQPVPAAGHQKAATVENRLLATLASSTPPVHAASKPKSTTVEDRLLATLNPSARPVPASSDQKDGGARANVGSKKGELARLLRENAERIRAHRNNAKNHS